MLFAKEPMKTVLAVEDDSSAQTFFRAALHFNRFGAVMVEAAEAVVDFCKQWAN
jgi:hypothetical protein